MRSYNRLLSAADDDHDGDENNVSEIVLIWLRRESDDVSELIADCNNAESSLYCVASVSSVCRRRVFAADKGDDVADCDRLPLAVLLFCDDLRGVVVEFVVTSIICSWMRVLYHLHVSP